MAAPNLLKIAMQMAYDERRVAERPMFLQSLFGRQPNGTVLLDTKFTDIDVVRENRRVAVDVVRGFPVGNMNLTQKFAAKRYAIPLYNEWGPVTPSMLLDRIPGENPYESEAGRQMARLVYHAAHIQAEQTKTISNAIEAMAAEVLQSGTITLVNTESLDFHAKSEHTVTPSTKWDDTGGDPISDLETLCDVIFQDGKIPPDTVVMGQSAWTAFINNDIVQEYMNLRYVEPGRIAPGILIEGARPWGQLAIGPYILNFYIYNQFKDEATKTLYVTTDTVIVTASNADYRKVFGAVEILKESEEEWTRSGLPFAPGYDRAEFRPYLIIDYVGQAYRAGVQSAPVLIPVAIDTFGTLINVDL